MIGRVVSREEVGYNSFVPGTEANGEVNVDDIRAKENVDGTVTYGLGSGLGSAEESGYVHAMAND